MVRYIFVNHWIWKLSKSCK